VKLNNLKYFSFPFLDTLFSTSGSLFYRLYLLKFMSLSEYGSLAIVLSIFDVFSIFTTGFVEHAVIKFYSKDKNINYPFIAQIWWILISILSYIVILISGDTISSLFKSSISKTDLFFIPIMIFTLSIKQVIKYIFESNLLFKQTSIVSITYAISLNLSIVVFSINNKIHTNDILLIIIYSNMITAIISVTLLYFKKLNFSINTNNIKENILEIYNFGKYSFGISASVLFYSQVDTLIIAALLPSSAVALYDAPKKLLAMIRLFSMTISKVLFPKISSIKNIIKQKELYFKYLKKSLILGSILAIISSIISPIIFDYIFDNKFSSVNNILIIFSAMLIIHPLANLSGNTLSAMNYPKKVFQTLMISMFINIILDIILIQKLGIIGAAIATVFALIFTGISNFYKIKKI